MMHDRVDLQLPPQSWGACLGLGFRSVWLGITVEFPGVRMVAHAGGSLADEGGNETLIPLVFP